MPLPSRDGAVAAVQVGVGGPGSASTSSKVEFPCQTRARVGGTREEFQGGPQRGEVPAPSSGTVPVAPCVCPPLGEGSKTLTPLPQTKKKLIPWHSWEREVGCAEITGHKPCPGSPWHGCSASALCRALAVSKSSRIVPSGLPRVLHGHRLWLFPLFPELDVPRGSQSSCTPCLGARLQG